MIKKYLLKTKDFLYGCMVGLKNLIVTTWGNIGQWRKKRKFLYLLDKLTDKEFLGSLSDEVYALQAYSEGTEDEYDDEIADRLLEALEALKGKHHAS